MIPLPAILFNPIAFPLQLMASRVAEVTLATLSIPVLREGNVMFLSNTTLEVAEACSGIRSLVSLLTLSIVFGYFTETSWVRRLVLALATIPIAIVANAFRVAGTGVLAHVAGPETADGFFHTFAGWLVFMAATVMLVLVQRLLWWGRGHGGRRRQRRSWRYEYEDAAGDLCRAPGGPGGRISPDGALRPERSCRPGDHAGHAAPRIPIAHRPWAGRPALQLDDRDVRMLGADDYLSRVYTNTASPPVDLFIGYYGSQRSGAVIHSPLNCLPGAGWQPVDRRRLQLLMDDPPDLAPRAASKSTKSWCSRARSGDWPSTGTTSADVSWPANTPAASSWCSMRFATGARTAPSCGS